MAHSIATGGSGTSAPWWLILPEQLVLVAPYFAPIWIAGPRAAVACPALRWCRAIGVAYPVLAVAFMATGGKPYYLTGMFPVLLAAGAQPAVDWIAAAAPRCGAALSSRRWCCAWRAPDHAADRAGLRRPQDRHRRAQLRRGRDNRLAGLRGEIAAVYHSLPAWQRATRRCLPATTARLARSTGSARPTASGRHTAGTWLLLLGPAASRRRPRHRGRLRRSQLGFCGSVRLAARLNNHVGVSDDEQGAPVWVCGQLRASWRSDLAVSALVRLTASALKRRSARHPLWPSAGP